MHERISLRHDITKRDIDSLICWVEDGNVMKYMNESRYTGASLREMQSRVDESLYTYHLNREGIFNLICDGKTDEPLGFIRFAPLSGDSYEIVYAVGKTELWGRGIGGDAVDTALDDIFLVRRASAVYARIKHGNDRSVRMIKNKGFRQISSGTKTDIYVLSFKEYLCK